MLGAHIALFGSPGKDLLLGELPAVKPVQGVHERVELLVAENKGGKQLPVQAGRVQLPVERLFSAEARLHFLPVAVHATQLLLAERSAEFVGLDVCQEIIERLVLRRFDEIAVPAGALQDLLAEIRRQGSYIIVYFLEVPGDKVIKHLPGQRRSVHSRHYGIRLKGGPRLLDGRGEFLVRRG